MEPRVALIPGGARGIGRAVALDLAASGWSVAICRRTSTHDDATLQRAIEAAGGRASISRCDISDPSAAAAWVESVQRRWQRIDALIVCVGPFARSPLLEVDASQWQSLFANNLHCVHYLVQAVAPLMIARSSGRVITFSVADADKASGKTHVTPYYIAKAGVLMLTRSLARVLAPHGITANTISPGYIDSGNMSSAEIARVTETIPAGHVGHLDDAVAAVRFLLSESARYVNGTNLHLSGAWGL